MGYFQYQTVDSWGWFWEVHTTASWISWGHPSMPWIVPWIGLDEWHCRLRQRCPERHAPPWTSAFPMLGIESIGEDCRVWGPLRSLEVPWGPLRSPESPGFDDGVTEMELTQFTHTELGLSMSTWETSWKSWHVLACGVRPSTCQGATQSCLQMHSRMSWTPIQVDLWDLGMVREAIHPISSDTYAVCLSISQYLQPWALTCH